MKERNLCPAQFLLGLSKGTYGKKSKNSERKKIVPTNPDWFFIRVESRKLQKKSKNSERKKIVPTNADLYFY
jgi:hypothetical protein